ncbi:MAG: hypothetical protein ABFD62_18990 [Syntrophaceae bacterium]
MLPENEVMDRAFYCYCVCLQLNWLLGNDDVAPPQYLKILKDSSLQLGDDDYIVQSITEALVSGEEDGGLDNLITIYESFAYAYCEVLEISMDDLKDTIPPERLKELAAEVGAEAKFTDGPGLPEQ